MLTKDNKREHVDSSREFLVSKPGCYTLRLKPNTKIQKDTVYWQSNGNCVLGLIVDIFEHFFFLMRFAF